jgi:hypothetical protein
MEKGGPLKMSDPNQHRGWNSPPAQRQQFVAPKPLPYASFLPRPEPQPRPAPAERNMAADPLIQGLMDRLPHRNETWTLDERAKWLRTAASIFGLVYKARDGEHREISVTLVEDSSGTSPQAISPGFLR